MSVVICFAQYVASGGTCSEEATHLVRLKQQDAQERQRRRDERAEASRKRKAARAAQHTAGQLATENDLEDSDIEDELDKLAEAQAEKALLAAPSLSKLVSDFLDTHLQGDDRVLKSLARALKALTTDMHDPDTVAAWHLAQVCAYLQDCAATC